MDVWRQHIPITVITWVKKNPKHTNIFGEKTDIVSIYAFILSLQTKISENSYTS